MLPALRHEECNVALCDHNKTEISCRNKRMALKRIHIHLCNIRCNYYFSPFRYSGGGGAGGGEVTGYLSNQPWGRLIVGATPITIWTTERSSSSWEGAREIQQAWKQSSGVRGQSAQALEQAFFNTHCCSDNGVAWTLSHTPPHTHSK